MIEELKRAIKKLNDPSYLDNSIISWAAPILFFGNINNSRIATLGLNPSNLEFVDKNGVELTGQSRRFHTLKSLNIADWADVELNHLINIIELCNDYFKRNPYDTWFKKLDYLLSGTSVSYYFPSSEACHLDLIPFATSCKWTALLPSQRSFLLQKMGSLLAELIKNSNIEILILNGQTVVENLETIAGIKLNKEKVLAWELPRKTGKGVDGYSYSGIINSIGGIDLKKDILVLGYNHNIQSSYGVTKNVQNEIRNWITINVNLNYEAR